MSDPLIQRLVYLASRPQTAPTCPADGTELDRHIGGSVSCPTCGMTTHQAAFPDEEEEEWAPSIPSLDEVARPSPERYFKWLHHPDLGARIWEVDGPDGEPWHDRELGRWFREHGAVGLGMYDETTRGYGVANPNGGVVHNYGSGRYRSDQLPGMALEFQEQYPDIPWRPYVPTEPLEG